jgi:hypothetical protein
MKKTYTFEVELIFEPTFESMVVFVDYETEDPESILEGAWEADFTNDILQNISIVPHTYTEEEL